MKNALVLFGLLIIGLGSTSVLAMCTEKDVFKSDGTCYHMNSLCMRTLGTTYTNQDGKKYCDTGQPLQMNQVVAPVSPTIPAPPINNTVTNTK